MKLTNRSSVPVYTISGSNTARPLPEWLARKRKRSLKQDPEYANRVELLQDFEFEEASSCIRISDDGDWVVSTGTYKPQMHVHYLPHLSLSFARHTNSLNQTFLLLSSDYSKSLHLQTDRSLEFHTPQGCHYTTRIPRYGRDLKYDKRSTEALVPSTGVNVNGFGEVYRVNLEVGRFMKAYEVDVGGDEHDSVGAGALQGGVNVGSVNTAAVAEDSHNLLAFGTSVGTVEFWDSRSRSRAGILQPPSTPYADSRPEITCLEFHTSGLTMASGSSNGLIHLYDLRSPTPTLKKDQGYGYPIHTVTFLTPTPQSSRTSHLSSEPKILSADKRIIKLWDARDGTPWTSVEPAVDINSVAWHRDSGMLLTANEGRQQHAFFIPSLGAAPRWCSFLDNMVEEMAEDATDPAAFSSGGAKPGEVYDNYRFVGVAELRALNLDHLVGTTKLLRPYMHGFFVAQQLYEQARLISQPELWAEQRQKSIRQRIDAERESRIRGSKKAAQVKVNRRLAQRLLERDEKNERRKAQRALARSSEPVDEIAGAGSRNANEATSAAPQGDSAARPGLLADPRFSALFQDEDFAVDEASREFQALNPSTAAHRRRSSSTSDADRQRGLTAAEQEELDRADAAARGGGSSAEEEDEESQDEQNLAMPHVRARTKPEGKTRNGANRKGPEMRVSASTPTSGRVQQRARDRSFGARAKESQGRRRETKKAGGGGVVGERSVTFTPTSFASQQQKKRQRQGESMTAERGHAAEERRDRSNKERRSASGNVMRRL